MKIVAFGHRQGVGKDTAAKFLISHLRTMGLGVTSVQKAGFADKLKSVAYELYSWAGLKPGDFYERSENRHLKEVLLPAIGKSPRAIWIALGNGLRERVHDATWYDYLLKTSRCNVLVIKDMRFPIEANGILAHGGYVYRIDCPWAPVIDDGADDPLEGYTRWTSVITNDGTLAEFHRKIVDIANGLFVQAT